MCLFAGIAHDLTNGGNTRDDSKISKDVHEQVLFMRWLVAIAVTHTGKPLLPYQYDMAEAIVKKLQEESR